jgi:hypothetical protein
LDLNPLRREHEMTKEKLMQIIATGVNATCTDMNEACDIAHIILSSVKIVKGMEMSEDITRIFGERFVRQMNALDI